MVFFETLKNRGIQEDDYLITKEGYEHLSVLAPRTVKDIEAAMKLPSPLDNFILPELGKEKKN
jgi:Xaa-Pro aminopeptidase